MAFAETGMRRLPWAGAGRACPVDFRGIDLQWFAAEDEGRTEDPSEYKLRKARDEEGRVPKSNELAASVVMLVGVLMLVALGGFVLRTCSELMVFFFTRAADFSAAPGGFYIVLAQALAKLVLPLAAAGVVAAVLANLVQNKGFIFTFKPITPQFSKITPKVGQYLKKTLFSFEGGFNVLKSFVKVVVVAAIAYAIINADRKDFLKFLFVPDIRLAVGRVAWSAAKILVASSVLFILIAVGDYFVQKKQFIESMKMTKQEVKQEFKEMEGDPEVKAHLDRAQRDLLSRNMPRMVAESDVVIANPTHFAVALKYDPMVAEAPQVTAKGVDALALRIRAIARENEVPVVENRPLARSLYAGCEVGDMIPVEFISAIATIYTQIDYMNRRRTV